MNMRSPKLRTLFDSTFGRVMKNILLAIIVIVSIIAVIFVKFILPILLLVAGFWIGLIGGLLKDK